MALINNINTAAKGSTTEVTLDKSVLFGLPSVTADPYFSIEANVAKVTMKYESLGSQKKTLVFDMAQSSPIAHLGFSMRARDTFILSEIILHDYDGDHFIVAASDIPSGLNIDLVAAAEPTINGLYTLQTAYTNSYPYMYAAVTDNNNTTSPFFEMSLEMNGIYPFSIFKNNGSTYLACMNPYSGQTSLFKDGVDCQLDFSHLISGGGTAWMAFHNNDYALLSTPISDEYGQNKMRLWVNSVRYDLNFPQPSPNQVGEIAGVVFTDNGDTHCAASVMLDNGQYAPCTWINGTMSMLDLGSKTQGIVTDIFADGSNVYITGHIYAQPEPGLPITICPCLWTNGVLTMLDVPEGYINSSTRSIVVDGNNTYVSGSISDYSDYKAVVWTNGVMSILDNGSNFGGGMGCQKNIAINNGSVYVFGSVLTTNPYTPRPAFWVDGVLNVPDINPYVGGSLNRASVHNNVVYLDCGFYNENWAVKYGRIVDGTISIDQIISPTIVEYGGRRTIDGVQYTIGTLIVSSGYTSIPYIVIFEDGVLSQTISSTGLAMIGLIDMCKDGSDIYIGANANTNIVPVPVIIKNGSKLSMNSLDAMSKMYPQALLTSLDVSDGNIMASMNTGCGPAIVDGNSTYFLDSHVSGGQNVAGASYFTSIGLDGSVYVVGSHSEFSIPTLYKNNAPIELNVGDNRLVAIASVIEDGGDTYIGVSVLTPEGVMKPGIIKNGVFSMMDIGQNLMGFSQFMTVSDGDVYLFGKLTSSVGKATPCYWLNGSLNLLDCGQYFPEICAAAVKNGTVYVVGNSIYNYNGENHFQPLLWINGVMTIIDSASYQYFSALNIAISSNGDPYVLLSGNTSTGPITAVWHNGSTTEVSFDNATYYGVTPAGIAFNGEDLVVALNLMRREPSSDYNWYEPAILINDQMSILSSAVSSQSSVGSLKIVNGSIYALGQGYYSEYSSYLPTVWVDGVRSSANIDGAGFGSVSLYSSINVAQDGTFYYLCTAYVSGTQRSILFTNNSPNLIDTTDVKHNAALNKARKFAGNVYSVGQMRYTYSGNDPMLAALWQNEARLQLDLPQGYFTSSARDVVVSGEDIIVVGTAQDNITWLEKPFMWLNGVSSSLDLGQYAYGNATCAVVKDGTTYIAGSIWDASGTQYAALWTNGVLSVLSARSYMYPAVRSMSVSNGQLLITGVAQQPITYKSKAVVWVNGVMYVHSGESAQGVATLML